MNKILDRLGLAAVNPGTWLGPESSEDASADVIESVNPATGTPIAGVRSTSGAEYDRVIAAARDAFRDWRQVPAPVRGDAVRHIAARCVTTRTRWAAWSRSRWARSRPKATERCRR